MRFLIAMALLVAVGHLAHDYFGWWGVLLTVAAALALKILVWWVLPLVLAYRVLTED